MLVREEIKEILKSMNEEDADTFNSLYHEIRELERQKSFRFYEIIFAYIFSGILGLLIVYVHNSRHETMSYWPIFHILILLGVLRVILSVGSFEKNLLYKLWPVFLIRTKKIDIDLITADLSTETFRNWKTYVEFLILEYKKGERKISKEIISKYSFALIPDKRNRYSYIVEVLKLKFNIGLFLMLVSVLAAYLSNVVQKEFLVITAITTIFVLIDSLSSSFNKYQIREYYCLGKANSSIRKNVIQYSFSSFNNGSFISNILEDNNSIHN